MRRLLMDTNIYVAFKRNDPEAVEAFRKANHIGVDVSVLAELYSGFRLGGREKENLMELEAFLNNPRVHVYEHNMETSEFFSHIYHGLRVKGKPIPANDIWIAAVAMQNGLALYSKDRHFRYIDGLIVYSA
ncbi:MAG TPA: type II toxin-antitoxin system VapC family toxin [bacterium]|nr:type II toxin-antitoxin system VapC family toxin [bacterium]